MPTFTDNKVYDLTTQDFKVKKDELGLEKIAVLLRHGDRTPMSSGPESKLICDIGDYVNTFLASYSSCLPTSGNIQILQGLSKFVLTEIPQNHRIVQCLKIDITTRRI